MEFIDNKLRRYTTFSKRKTGIMKKVIFCDHTFLPNKQPKYFDTFKTVFNDDYYLIIFFSPDPLKNIFSKFTKVTFNLRKANIELYKKRTFPKKLGKDVRKQNFHNFKYFVIFKFCVIQYLNRDHFSPN